MILKIEKDMNKRLSSVDIQFDIVDQGLMSRKVSSRLVPIESKIITVETEKCFFIVELSNSYRFLVDDNRVLTQEFHHRSLMTSSYQNEKCHDEHQRQYAQKKI